MEIVVYFDSSLKNLQKIKCAQQPECNPSTIALSIEPNYYGFSVNDGSVKKNPDYVIRIF